MVISRPRGSQGNKPPRNLAIGPGSEVDAAGVDGTGVDSTGLDGTGVGNTGTVETALTPVRAARRGRASRRVDRAAAASATGSIDTGTCRSAALVVGAAADGRGVAAGRGTDREAAPDIGRAVIFADRLPTAPAAELRGDEAESAFRDEPSVGEAPAGAAVENPIRAPAPAAAARTPARPTITATPIPRSIASGPQASGIWSAHGSGVASCAPETLPESG